MAIVIFGFGASVLAAFGIEQLLTQKGADWTRRTAWALIAAGLFIAAVAFCLLAVKSWAMPGEDRYGVAALAGVLAGALLLGWRKGAIGSRAAATALVVLMLIELGNVSGYAFADRNDSSRMTWLHGMWKNQDIAQFLNAQPKPLRVELDTEELPPNWPEYYNLDEIKAALASITVNETIPEAWSPQTRSLFNVRYTIGRSTTVPGATPVFEGEGGLKVFENPRAFPRAWAVHELVTISKPSQGHDLIRDHLDDLRSKAFESDPSGIHLSACSSPDNVTVTRYSPDHVTIRAAMACDGMVVLSDTFYPGWKATVDGRTAAVHEVNFAMRGVLVPRGMHEVQYRYRPASVYWGGALSALGILGACLLAFFSRRQRQTVDLIAKSRNNQE
jgi:hypothetical protein